MATRDCLTRVRRAARRPLGVLVAVALAITIASPTPTSASSYRRPLERLLVELWTDVLETPAADNPFATPGADDCWEIGPYDLIVSPFGPSDPSRPPGVIGCTVRRGAPVFVVLASLECSDIEGNGTSVEELTACANGARTDNPIHELRVDRHRFPVVGVGTDTFRLDGSLRAASSKSCRRGCRVRSGHQLRSGG